MITAATKRFIDISKWQKPGRLKWSALPADVIACVCRSTYGDTLDPLFATHFDAVVDARRSPGAYHFVTYDDADAQWSAFQHQLKLVKFGDPGDVLPVLDCEWLPGEKKPADPVKYKALVADLASRCDREYGGCILYTATGFWQQLGSPTEWLTRPWWVAHYPGDRSEAGSRAFASKVLGPRGRGDWQMWQSGPRVIPGFCADKIDYNYVKTDLPRIVGPMG